MPEPEGKVRVRLSVELSRHDEMRLLAAGSRLTLSQYAEAAVLDAIRNKRTFRDAPPPAPGAKPRGRPRKSS